MEVDGEPGSARYGNFINYYSFNPVDRRLKYIPQNLLYDLFCREDLSTVSALDIGCNAGDLTCALHAHLTNASQKGGHHGSGEDKNCQDQNIDKADGSINSPCKNQLKMKMLAVDLDGTLIQRSQINNSFPDDIEFKQLDIMNQCERDQTVNSFLPLKKEKFDIIFCFSTTMWIHLNHGDAGLESFLEFLASRAKYVLLEPQPWKCYQSAVKRMKKLDCKEFPEYQKLQYRKNVDKDIDQLLSKSGMTLIKCFGETSWSRTINLYKSVVTE